MDKLLKRTDFLAVNRGIRCSCHSFVLLCLRRSDRQGPPRVGFTVTRKVGNSVIRNRLKRRLRALARTELTPVAEANTDYVFIGRDGGLTREWLDLVADLKRGLGKLTSGRQDRAT